METLLSLMIALSNLKVQLAALQAQEVISVSLTNNDSNPLAASRNVVATDRTRSRTSNPISSPSPAPSPMPAPSPSPTPSPSPAPQPTDFAKQVEQYVATKINYERQKQGKSILVVDSLLSSIARSHSQDMLSKNYFSHTSPSGCGSACRLSNGGYAWTSYAENIHWMSGYNMSAESTAAKVVTDWMNSAGHRANNLSNNTRIGVGVAGSNNSKIYTTADFAIPR
jgi:uncharacterized protein YkwD